MSQKKIDIDEVNDSLPHGSGGASGPSDNGAIYGGKFDFGTVIYDEPQPQIDTRYIKRECEHEPINVGFNRAKIVCKKCDKDLEE